MEEKVDYSKFISALIGLSKKDIRARINYYEKDMGIEFLKGLHAHAFLDSLVPGNLNKDTLEFIYECCVDKINPNKTVIIVERLKDAIIILGIIPNIYYFLEIVKMVCRFSHHH